jgi:hypothetical protein
MIRSYEQKSHTRRYRIAMPATFKVRATFDAHTITVYQAFSDAIADAALETGRFVSPFSWNRMSWIKPSFLWLMERSNWGKKSGQERILAIKIARTGWDEALSLAVLTHPEPRIWPDPDAWRAALETAPVHCQWDPERSLRGAAQSHYAIQIGLGRAILSHYTDDWVLSIEDRTPLVRKIDGLIRSGKGTQAARLLPAERVYPVLLETGYRLGIAGKDVKR